MLQDLQLEINIYNMHYLIKKKEIHVLYYQMKHYHYN